MRCGSNMPTSARREASADTVHLELGVAQARVQAGARQGLRLEHPRIPVGSAIFTCARVSSTGASGRSLRRSCGPTFAMRPISLFLCGAREMETLTLKWDDVEREPK